jgi:uncharacterized membrane protein YbaN (DUF454 family)
MRPRPVRSKSISALYVIAGSISLGLGVLGMFLPLLPTTPLWLLAAACYARGSQRFHHWLIHHPMFGETIRRYQSGEGIPRKARNKTLIILWATLLFSAWWVQHKPWLWILLAAVGVGVTIYLMRLPLARVDEGS